MHMNRDGDREGGGRRKGGRKGENHFKGGFLTPDLTVPSKRMYHHDESWLPL